MSRPDVTQSGNSPSWLWGHQGGRESKLQITPEVGPDFWAHDDLATPHKSHRSPSPTHDMELGLWALESDGQVSFSNLS